MTSSVILAIAVLSTGQTDGGGTAFFEKKIRPVFVEYCYECHSGQSKDIKGDLRLDRKLVGPDSVVTPGKPDESKLIEAIRYTNSDLQMPPDGRLPKNVIADFERWVRMGAPDPRPRGEPAKRPTDVRLGSGLPDSMKPRGRILGPLSAADTCRWKASPKLAKMPSLDCPVSSLDRSRPP